MESQHSVNWIRAGWGPKPWSQGRGVAGGPTPGFLPASATSGPGSGAVGESQNETLKGTASVVVDPR